MKAQIRSVDIATADGTCDARFAAPVGDGAYPRVLFFADAFGLRPTIDDWIARIASQGYAVLAPNLLYRNGRAPVIADMAELMKPENRPRLFEQLRPMMRELTPERAMEDAEAYLAFLAEEAPGPVGVVGYCMGGAIALRTAAAFPDQVAAAASFHGGNLATDAENSPHLLAGSIAAEVYIGHADHDESASPEQQQRLADALSAAGVRFEAEVYPNAPHGFTMADTAAYREEAAERHFERLTDLFGRTLGRVGMEATRL